MSEGLSPRLLRREMHARQLTVKELSRLADVSEDVIYRALKVGGRLQFETERKLTAALATRKANAAMREAFDSVMAS